MKFNLKLLFIISFVFCVTSLFSQNVEVKGAGTADVNGIYVPSGKSHGKTQYVKGDYVLFYKGCHAKWMIKSPKGNVYRNKIDSNTPPVDGWEKGCGKGSMDPAPTISPVVDPPIIKKENE